MEVGDDGVTIVTGQASPLQPGPLTMVHVPEPIAGALPCRSAICAHTARSCPASGSEGFVPKSIITSSKLEQSPFVTVQRILYTPAYAACTDIEVCGSLALVEKAGAGKPAGILET